MHVCSFYFKMYSVISLILKIFCCLQEPEPQYKYQIKACKNNVGFFWTAFLVGMFHHWGQVCCADDLAGFVKWHLSSLVQESNSVQVLTWMSASLYLDLDPCCRDIKTVSLWHGL